MSLTRAAILIGLIPVLVGIIYWVWQAASGLDEVIDPAGALLLVMLGVSMGFGFLVILRGARDL